MMAEETGLDEAVRDVLATDLEILATLHDRELDGERMAQLRSAAPQDWLGLELKSPAAGEAFDVLDASLTPPEEFSDEALVDELAADFAEIYLNYRCQASPYESVWLDKDHLERQEPMFEVRKWYAHYGLATENWSARPEDHIALQLKFLAHLFRRDEPFAATDAARFMDRHILLWCPDFAATVAARCRTRFYAGMVVLTAAYLEELRDLLTAALEIPRPEPETAAEGDRRDEPAEEAPYFPGAGPSW